MAYFEGKMAVFHGIIVATLSLLKVFGNNFAICSGSLVPYLLPYLFRTSWSGSPVPEILPTITNRMGNSVKIWEAAMTSYQVRNCPFLIPVKRGVQRVPTCHACSGRPGPEILFRKSCPPSPTRWATASRSARPP